MKAKTEMKNLIDHYGVTEILDALSDILIEEYKNSSKRNDVQGFLDDMNNEFNPNSSEWA